MPHLILVDRLQRRLWAEQSDADLLASFIERCDHEAFAVIVKRYGPLVWSVCRRQLSDSNAIDDATQSTFLMLIRHAQRVRPGELAAWLVCVARRICHKSRRAEARRRGREAAAASPEIASAADVELSMLELMALLDEELSNLPSRYRSALLACYWQGLTQAETARQLGTTSATVKGLLERGRAKLLARLRERGLTSDIALRGLLAAPLALAALPDDLFAQILTSTESAMTAVLKWLPAASLLRWSVGGIAVIALGAGLILLPGAKPQDNRNDQSSTKQAQPAPPQLADALGDPLPLGVVARLGTSRFRPGGSIQRLAFSPDGKRLASWHEQLDVTKGLTIWNAADGRELRRVDRPGIDMMHCQWLADGRGIAIIKVDGKAYVWEFTDEKANPPAARERGSQWGATGPIMIVGQTRPDNESYGCFTVSPDGRRLVGGLAGTQIGMVRGIDAWKLTTGKNVGDLPKPTELSLQPDNCSSLFFTPDGQQLVAVSTTAIEKGRPTECLIVVWDAKNGSELHRFTSAAPSGNGDRMSIAVSNEWLALGLEDEPCTVFLWELTTGKKRAITAKHPVKPNNGFGISAITFAPNGRTLVTAGRAGDLRIWDVASLQMTRAIANASYSWIESLAVSPDGKTLASGGQDQMVRLWDMATGMEKGPLDAPVGVLTGVHLSADSKTALTFSADGVLRQWDMATGKQLRSMPHAKNERQWRRGATAPDGFTLLTNADGRVKALDILTCKDRDLPGLPVDLVSDAIHLAADNKTLLSLTADKVTLIDWPSLKVRRTVTIPPPGPNKLGIRPGEARILSADISPDGQWLITLGYSYWHHEEHGMSYGGAGDGVLDLWNAATGEYVRRLVTGNGMPRSSLFAHEGDILYVAGMSTLNGPGAQTTQMNGPISLIDPLTNRLKRQFAPFPGENNIRDYLHRIALSADGQLLFAATNSGKIVLYEMLTGQIRRTLGGYRGSIMDLAVSRDGRRLVAGGHGMNALVWDISLAGSAPAGPAPSPGEQANLWANLLSLKSEESFPAMQRLAANPGIAVALFRSVLKPAASGTSDELLDRLIGELGSENERSREAARSQLAEIGEAAVMRLKAALNKTSDTEVRTRIANQLNKLDSVAPDQIRESRALEILEQIDTPGSRQLLKDLAGGGPNARRTREAAAALHRLEQNQTPSR